MQTQSEKKEIKPGLKTHHRDQHGKLIAKTPYTLHIQRGTRFFESPKMSGNLWFEHDGLFTEPAGRIVAGQIDMKAEHVAYEAPKTGAEVFAAENHSLKQKMETLERELREIRKEQTANLVNEKAKKLVEASAKDAKKETKET